MKELIAVAVVSVLSVLAAEAMSVGFDGLREYRKIHEITEQRVREVQAQRRAEFHLHLE